MHRNVTHWVRVVHWAYNRGACERRSFVESFETFVDGAATFRQSKAAQIFFGEEFLPEDLPSHNRQRTRVSKT